MVVTSFLDLLLAEQEAEKKVINSRLAQWSLAKLERDGYCLSGLSAYWLQADRYGKPAAAFLLGPGTALPYHRFEYVLWDMILEMTINIILEMAHKSSYLALTRCKTQGDKVVS